MDDSSIIRLYFARSEAAIKATAEKYGALCHMIARNILSSDADAEECVNDAYLALWNRIPPETPQSLKAYAAKIVRHISLDRLDYNTAACRSGQAGVILDEVAEILPDRDAEAAFSSEIPLSVRLERFLDGEKKQARCIFVRRYWFCDSVAEIAARYGMSESGVKSVLFRVRRRLAAYLKTDGEG